MPARALPEHTAAAARRPGSTSSKACARSGVERSLFSSDFGNPDYPAVEDGLALWADRLLGAGFNDDEVRELIVGQSRKAGRSMSVGCWSSARTRPTSSGVRAARSQSRPSRGGEARVVALSYGERGESGELWKEPGQTVERVKEIRHGEAERAAAALGAEFDVPRPRRLSARRRPRRAWSDSSTRSAPSSRTCWSRTPTAIRSTPTTPARSSPSSGHAALAAGAGVASAFETITPPALFLFEPHQPELCNFMPTTFVDITSVIEQKRAAMEEMKAQSYLQTYYGQRAEQRGNHARRSSGSDERPVRRGVPARHAAGRGASCERGLWRARALGAATVHEAAARSPVVDLAARPGDRPARAPPGRRARCAAARATT